MKRKEPVFVAFLVIIVFGVYFRTFSYDLVWDDADFLREENSFFSNHAAWEAFKMGYFVEPGSGSARFPYYRPVVTASFFLERDLWGLHPWRMRFVNAALYVLGLIALYFFLRRQSEKGSFAEVTTLLFALNPLNADNIVWVVGRCDLFLFLWGSLALLALARHLDRPEGKGWILSSAAFALGVFSKESFLFFLPALVVYELVRRKRLTAAYHLVNLAVAAGFFAVKSGLLGIANPALSFLPGLGKNFVKLTAAAGYYARSVVFPVVYDRVLPDAELARWPYLAFGLAFGLAVLALVYAAWKNKALAVPAALLVGFVAGSLGLIFSEFVSYHLYARYMMVPALAATWLFVKSLGRLKELQRNAVAFLVFLLFIPSVVLNAYDYRTNLDFFQQAARRFPEEGFLSYQTATAYHGKGDLLNAELALQKALRGPLDVRIAASGRLILAQVEFERAQYARSRLWAESLDGIPPGALTPLLRYQAAHQKGRIALVLGATEAAERAFRENISSLPGRVDGYQELAHLYLGREEWEKAAEVERRMKDAFGAAAVSLDTAGLRTEFDILGPAERADFYYRHRNYGRAAEVLTTLTSRTDEQEIGLVRALLRAGRESEAKEVAGRSGARPSDGKALNALGIVFLREFLRAEDALACFRESFSRDRNQPEIASLIVQLSGYLQMARPLDPPKRTQKNQK
jgi:tetratricopeptide (TPR) repeat protein